MSAWALKPRAFVAASDDNFMLRDMRSGSLGGKDEVWARRGIRVNGDGRLINGLALDTRRSLEVHLVMAVFSLTDSLPARRIYMGDCPGFPDPPSFRHHH